MSDPEVAEAVAMWTRYAVEDLQLAEALLAERRPPPRHACFGAQQAAEKALKALYVARQVQYPFVHDLDVLAEGLGRDLHARGLEDLRWLSRWAKAPRYPFGGEPSWADAERAVRLTREVVKAARDDLGTVA
jgi:HEPN domain-containing protein